MVTTDALKLLYKKLGGTADVDNITAISDMIDLIEDVAGGGGASGLVVPVYTDDNVNDTLTCNLDYADIATAIQNNQCCLAIQKIISAEYVNYRCFALSSFDAEHETIFFDRLDGMVDPTTTEPSLAGLRFLLITHTSENISITGAMHRFS